MTNQPTHIVVEDRRASVVNQLRELRDSYETNFFSICELLLEISDNEYYRSYGYPTFADWVESGSIEISRRQAFYYLRTAKLARALNLTREQMRMAKISKLKEILSLDADKQAEQIRELVIAAPEMSLDEVRIRVSELKGHDIVNNAILQIKVNVSPSVKDTVMQAFELVRRKYGDTMDEAGNHTDISDGKCIEILAEEYLQDPNNYPTCESNGRVEYE